MSVPKMFISKWTYFRGARAVTSDERLSPSPFSRTESEEHPLRGSTMDTASFLSFLRRRLEVTIG